MRETISFMFPIVDVIPLMASVEVLVADWITEICIPIPSAALMVAFKASRLVWLAINNVRSN